jgi:hypothetical protein
MTQTERFFFDNAGFGYNPKTETKRQGKKRWAQELAKAEAFASEHGWRAEWVCDEDADASFVDTWEDVKDRDAWHAEEHTAEGCVLKDASGETLASLWGIFDADVNYRRVVEAELAQEAKAEMQARTADLIAGCAR